MILMVVSVTNRGLCIVKHVEYNNNNKIHMVKMQFPQAVFAVFSLLNFVFNLMKFEKLKLGFFVKSENFLGCCAVFHCDSNNY